MLRTQARPAKVPNKAHYTSSASHHHRVTLQWFIGQTVVSLASVKAAPDPAAMGQPASALALDVVKAAAPILASDSDEGSSTHARLHAYVCVYTCGCVFTSVRKLRP